jgi:polyferredoxin
MKRQNIRKALIIGAFLLFPVVIFYFSPYIIVEGAAKGLVAGSFVMFGIQFVLSLVFGRALCGWVCPVGGMQECMMLAKRKPAKGGRRNWIKWFIWLPWAALIAALFIRAGGLREFDFFFNTSNGVSLSEPFTYVIYYGVVGLVAVLALTAGRRAFCHYVCWMAPFMILGSKLSEWLRLPRLRLKAEKERCIGCKKCTQQCPMSLDVQEMAQRGDMRGSECILCGECVDCCPKKAIGYTFGNKKQEPEGLGE